MPRWEGKGQDEKGIDTTTGKVRVEVDPKYYRPTEVVSTYSYKESVGTGSSRENELN